MKTENFNEIVEEVMTQCKGILNKKAEEYAGKDDRLIQFKTAGTLAGISAARALAGMMIKHTTKLYSMIGTDTMFKVTEWEEVITDHINYLILLKALLIDEGEI